MNFYKWLAKKKPELYKYITDIEDGDDYNKKFFPMYLPYEHFEKYRYNVRVIDMVSWERSPFSREDWVLARREYKEDLC